MVKKNNRISEKDLSILANFYKDNNMEKLYNINNVEFFNISNNQNMENIQQFDKVSYIIDIKTPGKNELILIIDNFIEKSFSIKTNNVALNILKAMKDKYLK